MRHDEGAGRNGLRMRIRSVVDLHAGCSYLCCFFSLHAEPSGFGLEQASILRLFSLGLSSRRSWWMILIRNRGGGLADLRFKLMGMLDGQEARGPDAQVSCRVVGVTSV